jgi:hypothetical protein
MPGVQSKSHVTIKGKFRHSDKLIFKAAMEQTGVILE